ncbi:MAG TPA: Crp/Fnr family transcriptional regulator [Negativicutes bacterium]
MLPNQMQDFYSPWIGAQNRIWQSVLRLGQRSYYNKGDIILGIGQHIDHLYYLHVGQVKYGSINSEGNEKIMWYLDKGNTFGAAPFLDKRPVANAITAIDKCEVYSFSRECFNDEIVPKYPELITNLMQSMAYKNRVAVSRGGDMACLLSRVSKILFYVAQRQSDNQAIGKVICSKGISQQELAFILGVHRVTLNHVIAQLKREGIIGHIGKRNLIINSMERLLKIAQN